MKLSGALISAFIIGRTLHTASALDINAHLLDPIKTLRLLSLNCWGLPFLPNRINRMKAIGKEIGSGKYDVIGLQEIWSRDDWTTISGLAIDGGLNYSAYYPSGVIGSGLGIISRYPILDTDFKRFTVCGKPQNVFHGDYYGGKGIALARINTDFGEIDFYTTHFIAKYSLNDEYFAHRIAQAVDLVKFVSSTQKNGFSIVLGDINSEPSSLEYEIIKSLGNFTDCFNYLHPDDPGYTTSDLNSYTPNGRKRRIDYIFVKSNNSKKLPIAQSEVTMKFIDNSEISFSDHFGIYVSFEKGVSQLEIVQTKSSPDDLAFQSELIAKILEQIDEGIKDAKWRQGLHTNKAIAGLLTIPLSRRISQDILDNSRIGNMIVNTVKFVAPIYSFSELFLALSATNEEVNGLELIRNFLTTWKH